MAKIRLNEGHREFLRDLALKVATCPVEVAAEDAAYKKAAPIVKAAVLARFPAKDMAILRKYEVAEADDCIRLRLTAGGVEEFRFRDSAEAPMVPRGRYWNSRMYEADEPTTAAMQAWIKARDARKKAEGTKHSDYRALISGAQTLEEIELIWPEARALRERIARTLPMVLSEEVIKRIKADAAQRMKQAA